MRFIAFLIVSLFTFTLPSTDGNVIPFISDSQEADIAELPFLVSIHLRFISITSHICTGVLLSENFVLSSARCLSGRALSNLKIEFGQTVITPGNNTAGQKVGVRRVIYHPLFNETSREEHDLCILESNDTMAVNLLEPYANLATPNSRFMSGTRAMHASWGHISPDTTTFHLHRADLRIISMNECIEKVANATRVLNRENICAVDSAICTGDVGTPILVNRIVVGIASFRNGPPCQPVQDQFPNVYTAVSFYIGWIESVTGINYQVNTFLSRNL